MHMYRNILNKFDLFSNKIHVFLLVQHTYILTLIQPLVHEVANFLTQLSAFKKQLSINVQVLQLKA